jgi:DNA-binding transcriptional LysR family regulator
MNLNVSLKQMRSFACVCKHMSFLEAANELHMSPPAISMQIKQIETTIGLQLMERNSKLIHITQTGMVFLGYCQRILMQTQELQNAMINIGGLKGGTLTIGMVSTAKYFLPEVLAAFHQIYPDVSILIIEANRDKLSEGLKAGEIDLAIMGRPPSSNDIQSIPFASHPHGIISASDHPLAGQKNISGDKLLAETFIVRETGSGTRVAMETFFEELGIKPKVGMVMNNNETIKQSVMVNLGLSFIALDTARTEIETGKIAELDVAGLPVIKQWYLASLANRTLSPSAAGFHVFMIEHMTSDDINLKKQTQP